MVKKGNKATTQILVQWTYLLPEEATWEHYNFIRSQFLDFDEPRGQGSKGEWIVKNENLTKFLSYAIESQATLSCSFYYFNLSPLI